MVANILATWDRATDSDKEAGATWYQEAEILASELAADSGWTLEHAATVIAHLSQRQRWTRTVVGATALMRYGDRASGMMSGQFERAKAALTSDDPLGTLNGPKTRSFAANIMGDREAVTVDVWGLRIAGVDESLNGGLGRRGRYESIADAYREAARQRGVDPVTMQATTWIVARNGRTT